MTVTVWMMAIYINNSVPYVSRAQRFDTLAHCQAFVDKINAVGVKPQTTRYFCAEGLMEMASPATTDKQ